MLPLRVLLLPALLLPLAAIPAAADQISWTGTLGIVDTDSGTSIFSGLAPGTALSGTSSYDTVCDTSPSGNCFPDTMPVPGELDYFLSGRPGSLQAGSLSLTGADTPDGRVTIANDLVITAGDLSFLAALGLTGLPVTAGSLVDGWSVASVGTLANGNVVEFTLDLFSVDATLFSDLSYQGTPPPPGNRDVVLLNLTEEDSAGNLLYEGVGVATISAIVVPEPGTMALLLAGLAGTVAGRTRRRA